MSTQVAVRLNDELLESLDWLVLRFDYENRAEAMRTALQELTKRKRNEEIDTRIREAYERTPMTEAERIAPNWAAIDALDNEDWSTWR